MNEICILNVDSPSYPADSDEYLQCGCSWCLKELEGRMKPTTTITDVRMVQNLREPDKPWRCAWQTCYMTAPAFWYYATKEEADAVAHSLCVSAPEHLRNQEGRRV